MDYDLRGGEARWAARVCPWFPIHIQRSIQPQHGVVESVRCVPEIERSFEDEFSATHTRSVFSGHDLGVRSTLARRRSMLAESGRGSMPPLPIGDTDTSTARIPVVVVSLASVFGTGISSVDSHLEATPDALFVPNALVAD